MARWNPEGKKVQGIILGVEMVILIAFAFFTVWVILIRN